MQNSLRTSRQKIDAEIMYSLRRQGMTNKQIADNLGVTPTTVYRHIGRMSEAVKHAEVQHKPPVVDAPVISPENGFKPFVSEAEVAPTPLQRSRFWPL